LGNTFPLLSITTYYRIIVAYIYSIFSRKKYCIL